MARNLPPYPSGNILEWARQITDYLIEGLSSESSANDPSPAMMQHKIDDTAKAAEDGVVMYDPAKEALILSVSGEWRPIYPTSGADYVLKAGDTMTGPLSVPADATGAQVPQVQEVVKKTGDTMTGNLTIDNAASGILFVQGDEQANIYLQANMEGTSPSSSPHIWFQKNGSNVGLLYNDSGGNMSLRHYNGGTVGGSLQATANGIAISGIDGTLNMRKNNLVNCNYIMFDGGTSGDYIRWLTAKGMVGYENGVDKFRLYSGAANPSRIESVGSATTGSNANVYTSSSGYMYRSTSSGKYKTNFRPLSGVSKQAVGDVIDALNPLIFTGKIPDESEAATRLSAEESPSMLDQDMVGFIAEEVNAVIPEASQNSGENYDTRAVVAYLTAEIQTLRKRVAELESPTQPNEVEND